MSATSAATITIHLNGMTFADMVKALRRSEAEAVEGRKLELLAYYNRRYPIDGSEPDLKAARPL